MWLCGVFVDGCVGVSVCGVCVCRCGCVVCLCVGLSVCGVCVGEGVWCVCRWLCVVCVCVWVSVCVSKHGPPYMLSVLELL